MANPSHDSGEQADTLGAIQELAEETHRPFAEVKEVYEVELARLKSDARIMDYVALFASRRTRARLFDVAD
jgi:hypothetical protein